MRQLDTCDFCGDAPEGVYEVVPASVAGDPKRLALCADCRDTLRTVVDPLLDAANAATTDEPSDESRAGTTAPDSATQPPTSTPQGSGTAVDDAIGSATDPETDEDSHQSADEDATDGVTIQADDDASGDVDQTIGEDGDEEAGEDGDASEAAAGGSPARRPDGYAQIIRLLQNRDGGMPREDLHALATNAYDLGDREFEAAVEAAVENGEVEETAEGLRTA